MAGVEGLGNVGAGKLNDNALLALAGVLGVLEPQGLVVAKVAALLLDQRQRVLEQRQRLEKELDKVAVDGGRLDQRVVGREGGHPLGRQRIGLLALDAQRRRGQDQVALVEARGPLQRRVHEAGVDARHLGEHIGEVRAVEVKRVGVRVAVGVLLLGLLEAEALDEASELVDGSGSHGRDGVETIGRGRKRVSRVEATSRSGGWVERDRRAER